MKKLAIGNTIQATIEPMEILPHKATQITNEVKANARIIGLDAIELAKEACQIAAVCRKILGETDNAK